MPMVLEPLNRDAESYCSFFGAQTVAEKFHNIKFSWAENVRHTALPVPMQAQDHLIKRELVSERLLRRRSQSLRASTTS
jgi:hypothetical protein